VDWVNLPKDATELSLWCTLHDGDLTSIDSDLLARTLTLRFDVGYVRDFHNLSEETVFTVNVGGVASVRSCGSVPWPGGCSIPAETPIAQQEAIVAEYQNKWREESLSWAEFEQLTKIGLEVSSATLAQRADGIALHFGFLVNDGSYVEAYIRGETVGFLIGERQFTAPEFVEMGEAYWEAWGKKQKTGEHS
jgi:hypothetical protein